MTENVLTNLIRNVNAEFMEILNEAAPFPKLVDTDFSSVPVAKGQTLRTPITPVLGITDRSNAMIPTLVDGETTLGADIQVTWDKVVKFKLSGDDYAALNLPTPTEGYISNNMIEAMRVMRNYISNFVAVDIAKNATAAYGTAGQDPFAAPTAIGAILPGLSRLKRFMRDSLAPNNDQNGVITTSAMDQLGTNPALVEVQKSGSDQLLRDGIVGRIQGFGLAYDQTLADVAVGTAAAYVIDTAAVVGDATLSLKTGTGTILPGDVIAVAGDPSLYIAGPQVNPFAGPGLLPLSVGNRPGKNVGYVNFASPTGTAVTVYATGTRMPFFQKGAYKLIARPSLVPPDGDQAKSSAIFQDTQSGVYMRLAYYLGYGVNQWELQVSGGGKTIRPELAKVAIGI